MTTGRINQGASSFVFVNERNRIARARSTRRLDKSVTLYERPEQARGSVERRDSRNGEPTTHTPCARIACQSSIVVHAMVRSN